MRERDFDYRREGWQQSPLSDSVSLSSAFSHRGWCAWLASQAFQAVMVAICLVVAVLSFLYADDAARYSQGSDLSFATSVSLLLGGFLAIVAAITRCWWLLVLAFLPSVWAAYNQGYYDNDGSLVALTYIFDGCVIVLAAGLLVARCRQDAARRATNNALVDDEDEDGGNDKDKRPSHSGRNRRGPMETEIV